MASDGRFSGYMRPDNRSLTSLFLSNAFVVILTKIASIVAILAVNVFLSQMMSPEDLGRFFIALLFANIVSLPLLLGFNFSVIKGIAALLSANKSGDARALINLSLVVSTIGLFLGAVAIYMFRDLLFGWLFRAEELALYPWLLSVLLVSTGFKQLIASLMLGVFSVRLSSIFQGAVLFCIMLSMLIGHWFLVEHELSLKSALFYLSTSSFLSCLLGGILFYPRYRGLNRSSGNTDAPIKIKQSLPLILPNLVLNWNVFSQIVVLILAVNVDESEVASYALALRIAMLVDFGLPISQSIAAPYISTLFSQKHLARLTVFLRLISSGLLLPTGLIGLLVIVFADYIVLSFFGPEYSAAANILRVLVIGRVLYVTAGLSFISLAMTSGEKWAQSTALYTVAAFGLFVILGNRWIDPMMMAIVESLALATRGWAMWWLLGTRLSLWTHPMIAWSSIIRSLRIISKVKVG